MSKQDQTARRLKRLPTGLPGTPQGEHVQARPGGAEIACRCGACSNKGRDMTVVITLKEPR